MREESNRIITNQTNHDITLNTPGLKIGKGWNKELSETRNFNMLIYSDHIKTEEGQMVPSGKTVKGTHITNPNSHDRKREARRAGRKIGGKRKTTFNDNFVQEGSWMYIYFEKG